MDISQKLAHRFSFFMSDQLVSLLQSEEQSSKSTRKKSCDCFHSKTQEKAFKSIQACASNDHIGYTTQILGFHVRSTC